MARRSLLLEHRGGTQRKARQSADAPSRYPARMNYRHAFHAGNHADVLKHLILLVLLDALKRKDTPFFVLDTHAGRGRYELTGEAAEKTGEAQAGIVRLRQAMKSHEISKNDALSAYLNAVSSDLDANHYPGSPQLVARELRAADQLACCEWQPEEASALKTLFAHDVRVAVHQRDGYGATKALLPPKEKRGLVLIDPPFEAQLAEFDTALDALRTGLTRWPQGIFTLWYPIKQRRTLAKFLRDAVVLPSKSAWIAELHIRSTDSPLRMNGSGMLVLNPPWKADEAISPVLPRLAKILGEQDANSVFQWLKQGS